MSDEVKELNGVEQSPETVVEEKPTYVWRPQDADREYIKAYTRNRVRNSHVSENAVFIPAKPKPTIQDEGHKRVAVYARVSTKSKEQVSSIENQTKYYTEKIQKTENWELQALYSDEGKSGTSMRKREKFQLMLAAAANKEMDLILCASVSRFARNVSDCIEKVRELKTKNPSHPVGVYFETENIYTLDPDSNQMLGMHAMLADWESANKSRRMILSYDQRICTGQYPVLDLLGFKHTIDGDLIIEKDGALTCRFAFYGLMYGYTAEYIAEVFTRLKRKTLTGRTTWNAQMIRNLVQNERRWGDLQVRKTIVVDYVKGKTVKNNQIRDAAFVPNHHEGIVSPAIGRAVKIVASSGRKFVDGIMDIGVIESGGLKGFVSVCPAWSGVDCDMFLEVCRGVYNDEEYAEMEKEARIVTGQESSNVLSMTFTGYEVPRSAYFINRSTACLTLSMNKIQFNKNCHEKLNHCSYIETLYHPILQAIVVRECSPDSPNAVKWSNEGKMEFSFTAGAFCNAIYEQLMWIKDYRFKFRGVMRERGGKRMLLFFLDEPLILVGKKKRKADLEGDKMQERTVKFIPYKQECGGQVLDESLKAYPEHWQETGIGMSYGLRKRRDKLANEVTSTDIVEPIKIVVNPLIGQLPTRAEIEVELNEMLVAMGG